jgi:AcrR family transcriptional regulator
MDRSFGLRSNPMSKAPSTRSRPTRSDAQRQAILDAACLLFIDRGFGGTNINDIADAVGVTCTLLRSDENC